MHKSQANRQRIEQRIMSRLGPGLPIPTRPTRPGTDLTARVLTEVKPSGFVTRRNRSGATRGQRRDSTGGSAGAWNRSAAGEMRRTGDRRWDLTVRDMS